MANESSGLEEEPIEGGGMLVAKFGSLDEIRF